MLHELGVVLAAVLGQPPRRRSEPRVAVSGRTALALRQCPLVLE
jgi:hypothetical protein